MLSATTAESSDSIAPSRANESASGSTACDLLQAEMRQRRQRKIARNAAELGCRSSRPAGRAAQVASAASATAISMAGQCGRQMRKPASSAMLTSERPSATGDSVDSFDHRTASFGTKGPAPCR